MSGISASPNQALSDFFVSYSNNLFIADRLAPVKTATSSELFYYRSRLGSATDDVDIEMSPNGQLRMTNDDVERVTATLKDYGLGSALPVKQQLELEQFLSKGIFPWLEDTLFRKVMLNREVRVANYFTTAGNYSSAAGTSSPGTKWGSATTAQIKGNIRTAVDAIIGADPSEIEIIMGADAFNTLVENANVQAVFSYTQYNAISADMVAAFLGVKKIHVGRAKSTSSTILNSANPTTGFVWSDHCVVFKPANPDAAPMATGFALTLRESFEGYGTPVRQWLDNNAGVLGVNKAAVGLTESVEMVAPKLGYLLTDCVA